MSWDKNYRMLKEGEIIKAGDEVMGDRFDAGKEPVWKPTICAGQLVPDPRFLSHRLYRRRIKAERAEQSP